MSDFGFIHCERCNLAWPTDKPGLDDHEASCCAEQVCRSCFRLPGRCFCDQKKVRWPARTDAPYCRACGMTEPHHWPGCPNEKDDDDS